MRLSFLKIFQRFASLPALRDNADRHTGAKRRESARLRGKFPRLALALACLFLLSAAAQSPTLAQNTPALAAPTDLTASISAEGVTISWTAPEGTVDGYEILRQRPQQDETELSTLVDDTESSDVTYSDTSATTLGEQYVYAVKTIRGSERSAASDSLTVDYPTVRPVAVSLSCEGFTGITQYILRCRVTAEELSITSATWTPSYETEFEQTTAGPMASWVIADEFCGQSTTVEVDALAGERELPTAETTVTLDCPPPADANTVSVSCDTVIENSQHKLSCQASAGEQSIDTAYWTAHFETENAQETSDLEATWDIADDQCGQSIRVEVSLLSGSKLLPTAETTISIPCVITVDNDCSLANAIRSANGNAQVEESGDSDGNDDCEDGIEPDDSATPPKNGEDIIHMTRNTTLTATLPSITSLIRIEGADRQISGDDSYQIFNVSGGELEIRDLTLINGLSSTFGGAIYINSGSLTISDSKIKDSQASDIGGAIYAIDSDVHIVDSEISGNSTLKSHGGGVYFISSTGLNTLNISGVTFKNNTATEDGGALKTAGGVVTITKSSFVGNTGDEGGAIESSETTLFIENSTFSANSAREGGGLSSFSSDVTLTHTTWAKNSADEQGGGIAIIGWTGSVKIRNTLISGSTSGGDCHSGPNPDIITEFTGNHIEDGSCTPIVADSQAAPADDTAQAQQIQIAEAQISGGDGDPMLGGLTGDPPHHPLQEGSPAINAADPVYCLLDDQPDTARPQFGNCDIGAYEFPRAPDPPQQPPDPPDEDEEEPEDEPTDTPTPPTPEGPTPTPTPQPNICPVNERIMVRTPNDDVECAEIDTISLDKHPALQGARLAMRLWRSNNNVCTHIVSSEENLYRLAIHYETTVEVLRRHNNLATDILTVGQSLLLPACEAEDAYFAPGTEVCFADPGGLVFVDTSAPERPVHTVATYVSDGMTCGAINKSGTVVLVASAAS